MPQRCVERYGARSGRRRRSRAAVERRAGSSRTCSAPATAAGRARGVPDRTPHRGGLLAPGARRARAGRRPARRRRRAECGCARSRGSRRASATRELAESLRPLLDLPVERVLVSHGEPVLENGEAQLAAAFGADSRFGARCSGSGSCIGVVVARSRSSLVARLQPARPAPERGRHGLGEHRRPAAAPDRPDPEPGRDGARRTRHTSAASSRRSRGRARRSSRPGSPGVGGGGERGPHGRARAALRGRRGVPRAQGVRELPPAPGGPDRHRGQDQRRAPLLQRDRHALQHRGPERSRGCSSRGRSASARASSSRPTGDTAVPQVSFGPSTDYVTLQQQIRANRLRSMIVVSRLRPAAR